MRDNIEKLPLVAIRGLVMFPNSTLSFEVGRTKSVMALEQLTEQNNTVFLSTQKDPKIESPDEEEIYHTGTISVIKKVIALQDDMVRIIAEGKKRGIVEGFIKNEPYFEVLVREIEEDSVNTDNKETLALIKLAQQNFTEYSRLSGKVSSENIIYANSAESASEVADIIMSSLNVSISIKQGFLEQTNPIVRLKNIITLLDNETEILDIQKDILLKVKQSIDKNQKDYFLREHLKAIQDELGDKDGTAGEIKDYEDRMQKMDLPNYVLEKLKKEIYRLKRTSGHSQEGVIIRDYIDLVLDLPWNIKSEEINDLTHAQDILNADHYGLKKVKERILEFLAVKQNINSLDAPIMCLVGPPGVGKTSIAKSIAKALNRNHVRISLGGVHDESEIRGHRKTYVGAMPGRIVSSIKNAGTSNPLILLDEIDKMGKGVKGDPTSALLEVLDNEQNIRFRDNYLELPYDISDVLFICTANNLESIPVALRDRLDVIQLSSYTNEEKNHIATDFLIHKQIKKHGLEEKNFKIKETAILDIINYYTKEAGVRQLERFIGTLCRKAVKEFLLTNPTNIVITSKNLEEYLGKKKFRKDKINELQEIGVVRGLAWTSLGGDTLSIEVNKAEGKGNLKLTGNMGNIMKESAMAALSFIRSNSDILNIDKDFYKNTDIHIHIPEGAIPKDGPSAGITMATAMVSLLANKPVRYDVSMTGEITIRGKVLPIGGLKEKALAAKAAGIKKVLIPIDNEGDYDELEDYIKSDLEFVLVKDIHEVLKIALI